MAISARTLFHFTDTFEKLSGILKSNFIPHFSLEDYGSFFLEHRSQALKYAVPMVCFCDIPLSQIGEHVEDYGHYAIGLSKEWATRMHLNPVIYINRDSELSNYIFALVNKSAKETKKKEKKDIRDIVSSSEILAYCKPYIGNITKIGKPKKEKVFYNEREWRYVPYLAEDFESPWRLREEEFLNEETRNSANSDLSKKVRLEFEPADIKYILISKEEEIIPLINKIERVKSKYSYRDVRILTTKRSYQVRSGSGLD
jgi:hypothetical protein